jgi:GTP-binding protein
VVLLVNKWDLVEKDTNTLKGFEKIIREKCAPFQDFPVIFISAINKQRVFRVLETAMEVFQNRTQKIQTSALNKYMLEAIEQHPPPAHKGKYIRIKYVTQLPTHAPSFAFYANLPQYIREPYKRYLENRMREKFKLTGVPIQIFFREK